MKKNLLANRIRGYTLIELLAVMVVMIATGTIITSILVTTLRGGNKGNTTNNVRQNGNYVITQMTKMIAYARSFDGVSTDGTTYSPDCTVTIPPPPNPTPTPIPYKYIKITSFDGGTTIFSCNGSTDIPPYTIASQSALSSTGQSLIDSSLRITSCVFYCSQDNISASPRIDIDFTITSGAASLFAESKSSISFQTSVTPRN